MADSRTAARHPAHGAHRVRVGVYLVLAVSLTIAAIAALAAVTRSALIFPPLGASAYIIFAHPRARAARPRDVVLGIWIGIVAGWLSQLAFDLDTPDLGSFDADWRHVGSAGLALTLSTAALVAVRVDHPPGCAAALLVALGIWSEWDHAILGGGALVLAMLGITVHRAIGLPYPLWSGRPAATGRGYFFKLR